MSRPEAPENPPIRPPEVPLLTFIPELQVLQMTNLPPDNNGSTQREHTWASPRRTEDVSYALSDMYTSLGNGVFTLSEITEQTGIQQRRLASLGKQLTAVLPEAIFGYAPGASMRFGDFAIASRKPTEEEARARSEHIRHQKTEDLARKKEKVLAADGAKTTLIDADHVLITANGVKYYMPIETTEAIGALRTLAAIRTMRKATNSSYAPISELVKVAWSTMPIAERELFTQSENQLYGEGGSPITELVKRSLRQVASPLNIARHGSTEALFEFTRGFSVVIGIKREPPTEPYDKSVYTPIFPPGTEKSIAQQSTLGEVSDNELSDIREVLGRLVGAERLSHNEAVEVVDLLMNRRSKILARRLLVEQHGAAGAEAVLQRLNGGARASLGHDRYYAAKAARSIGRFGSGKGAQQVSNRLPGRTFNHVETGDGYVQVTSRWYFGTQASRS